MSIGIGRLSADLMPGRALGDGGALRERIALWEDLLTLVVDPDSAKVADRERKRAILSRPRLTMLSAAWSRWRSTS